MNYYLLVALVTTNYCFCVAATYKKEKSLLSSGGDDEPV